MQEIHSDSLWIGHALDIREPRPLFDLGISAVVDVAYDEPSASLPRQLTYCRFPLVDGGGNDKHLLALAVHTTASLLSIGAKTIVACSAGMSRSPTIAAFALEIHLGIAPEEAIARIAELKTLELNPELWGDVFESMSDS